MRLYRVGSYCSVHLLTGAGSVFFCMPGRFNAKVYGSVYLCLQRTSIPALFTVSEDAMRGVFLFIPPCLPPLLRDSAATPLAVLHLLLNPLEHLLHLSQLKREISEGAVNTSVLGKKSEWGRMGKTARETYLFVFLKDQSFPLCVKGGQWQRNICLAHFCMLLKQTSIHIHIQYIQRRTQSV